MTTIWHWPASCTSHMVCGRCPAAQGQLHFPARPHPPTSVNEEGKECDDNGDKRPMSPACRGTTFIKGCRTLDELNCHDKAGSWSHTNAERHLDSGLQAMAGAVFQAWPATLYDPGGAHMTAVSAAGGTRWGDGAHQMEQHSLQGPILSQAGGGGMFTATWLQIPTWWAAHMIKTYGYGQKVAFEGGICSVKLLLIG